MRNSTLLFLTGIGLVFSFLSISAQNLLQITSDTVLLPQIKCCDFFLTKTVAFAQPDILSDGGSDIIEYGVTWGLSPHFDSTLNRVPVQHILVPFLERDAGKITGLVENTTYYIRGYAINSAGTAYSRESSFTATWDPDIQTGLIAYYPFNGNANDSSGNNHHGTSNGVSLAADRFGKPESAFSFNGEKNTLSFQGFSFPGPATTITAWIKPNDKSSDTIFYNTIPDTFTMILRVVDYRYQLDLLKKDRQVYLSDSHGFTNFDPARPRYDFIAVVIADKDVTFYVNNIIVDKRNLTESLIRFDSLKTTEQNPEFVDRGIMDDLRIYSRQLSNTDILELQSDRPNTEPVITANYLSAGTDFASVHSTINYDPTLEILETGVCWSTSPNPDLNSNKVTGCCGTASIISTITGLLPDTTYYVRAYATNSVGTGYSNELTFTTSPAINYGTLTDIDGNQYKTVRIGTQNWMAENLKTTRYADGIPIENGTLLDNKSGKYYFIYDNDSNYIDNYGLLYTWQAATNSASDTISFPNGIKGACPSGWHIPTYAEMKYLVKRVGSYDIAGGKLKEAGFEYWDLPNEGATNESGFSARGSGYMKYAGLNLADTMKKDMAFFWTSEFEPGKEFNNGYRLSLNHNSDNAVIATMMTNEAISVRCIMDTTLTYIEKPSIITKPVTGVTHDFAISGGDITYDGGQLRIRHGICWSTNPQPDTSAFRTVEPYTENEISSASREYVSVLTELTPNTTYYVRAYAVTTAGVGYGNEFSFITAPDIVRDTVTDIEGNAYRTVIIGKQHWMAENLKTTKLNDGTPIPLVTGPSAKAPSYYLLNDDTTSKKTYGLLYNSYSIKTENVCPLGWHVPDTAEWGTLIRFLGDSAANRIREAGYIHWPRTGSIASNVSGFTALPGKMRPGTDIPDKTDAYGAFWSATDSILFYVTSSDSAILTEMAGEGGGASVRCLEDTSSAKFAFGDINGDKNIRKDDALWTLQYSVGLDPIQQVDSLPWQNWRIKAADVDMQKGITAYDAALILQYEAGLINHFPAEDQEKNLNTPVADIHVTIENGYLLITPLGKVYGLNFTLPGSVEWLGTPEVSDSRIIIAVNNKSGNYAIGLASAYAPDEGSSMVRIPVNKMPDGKITVNVNINDSTKQYILEKPSSVTEKLPVAAEFYPNPAGNVLYISHLSEKILVSIYDMKGHVLIRTYVQKGSLDISSLKKGTYLIEFRKDKEKISRKFVKE